MKEAATEGDRSISALRGAEVRVDPKRTAWVIGTVCLLTVTCIAMALFVAGASKNAQITSLREHGTAVEATVTGCIGLLGGSGSNAAGYTCRGNFEFEGRGYNEVIPGIVPRDPGTKAAVVAAPGNPPLLSTPGIVASSRASLEVYVLPSILLFFVVATASGVALNLFNKRKKKRSRSTSALVALRLGG